MLGKTVAGFNAPEAIWAFFARQAPAAQPAVFAQP